MCSLGPLTFCHMLWLGRQRRRVFYDKALLLLSLTNRIYASEALLLAYIRFVVIKHVR